MTESNWAGNIQYTAARVRAPRTLEELQEIVANAPRVRVVGTRHAFGSIADSDEMVSLASMPPEVSIDPAASAVTCGAGMRYGDLAAELDAHGLALHNLASLPHISVGGAVATGTHGSGDRNGNLATAVMGLEVVTSAGAVVRAKRGDPDFDGMVVGLGALGAVTRLTLQVQPEYQMAQRVYLRLPWNALLEQFDAITSSGYSLSLFTDWGETVNQVWVKTRNVERLSDEFFGAEPATRDMHPIISMDPANCTHQLGVPGAWWERLTHFRMGFVPSSGDELQSEYMVPRARALAAIETLRGMADRLRPLLQISEVRTVAADTLWMSPMYGRETVCLHFTWRREPREVDAFLPELEAALDACAPRPHWGKLFAARADALSHVYERRPDYLRLVERLDPRGAFRNAWFQTHLLGDDG